MDANTVISLRSRTALLIVACLILLFISNIPGSNAFNIRKGSSADAQVSMNGESENIALSTFNKRVLQASSDFSSLSCNIDLSNCSQWPYGSSIASSVEVPCNTCYTMSSYLSGETISIDGIIDIKGKLEFPEGTKVKLQTKGIIVQGELSMTSTKIIDGTPDIVIELLGSEDILFTPHEQNEVACGGSGQSCNLGPKPLVVAGGKLDIKGMPDDCPSWTHVEQVLTSPKSVPLDGQYRARPELPIPSKGTCYDTLLNYTFESGGTDGWYGNLGAEESIHSGSHDGSNYLHIEKRTGDFQGPMIEIDRYLRECIITETDYFFRAKIRLSPGNETGPPSLCSTTGVNCPILQFSHMNWDDKVRFHTLAKTENVNYVDGQWHEIKANFRFFDAQVNATDIFSLIAITGPEPGIDISIDDVSISIPPMEAYPDPLDVCGNLVLNGDASTLNGFSAPMYPFIRSNNIKLLEEDINGVSNSYFSITDRKAQHDNIAMDLTPACLAEGSVYTFSFKYRIHSNKDIIPRIIIKTHTDGEPIFDIVANDCLPSSSNVDWETCSNDFSFKSYHSISSKVELLVYLKEDSFSVVDYDDFSFIFKNGAPTNMKLEQKDGDRPFNQCWGAGAEVIFPSMTMNYYHSTVTTLKTVLESGVIDTIKTIVPSPTTKMYEGGNAAGEVGLLSRNIMFSNGDGESNVVGPSLVILNTPGAVQMVQGVELNRFGMQGIAGKHAVNIKNSGNSTSIISKNSILYSNNRCINIHGTDNMMVEDNVSYKNYGHCYALEGTGEIGNTFKHNLGVETLVPETVAEGLSDKTPATFWITYPTNSWLANSAAGSQAYGFWFELNKPLDDNIDPWMAPLTAFEDNVSHSNFWFGIRTSPYGYNPSIPAILSNTRVYKNRGQGVFLHNTGNFIIDGGYFADNRYSIDIMQDNAVTIQNVKIVGFSDAYRDIFLANKKTTPTVCGQMPFTGIKLHIREKEDSLGLAIINNVTFTNFDELCSPMASAIAINNDLIRGKTWDTEVLIQNLTMDGVNAIKNRINFCEADANGINDISVVDGEGSLNPENSGPGYIVSNDINMVNGRTCSILTGSCAMYCLDSNAGNVAAELAGGGDGENVGEGGDNGLLEGGVERVDVGICLRNVGFEAEKDGWRAVNAGNLAVVEGYNGTGKALKVSNRLMSSTGSIWQDFQSSCLTAGAWYEIKADVKMTNKGADTIFNCNPTNMWTNDPKACAGIGLFRKTSRPPLRELAYTLGPYDGSGWAKIYGIFQASDDIMSETSLGFVVGRAATSADITVDNVALIPATASTMGITDCSNTVFNGDAEVGDHRFWWIFGQDDTTSLIEMSSPGADGSNFAFKHSGTRDRRNRGMLQKMDNSCFTSNSNWIITAKFRYFKEDGTFVECIKANPHAPESCPVFHIQPGGFMEGTKPLVNVDDALMEVGKWNVIKHEVTIETATSHKEMYLLVNSVRPGYNYELDDIAMVPA